MEKATEDRAHLSSLHVEGFDPLSEAHDRELDRARTRSLMSGDSEFAKPNFWIKRADERWAERRERKRKAAEKIDADLRKEGFDPKSWEGIKERARRLHFAGLSDHDDKTLDDLDKRINDNFARIEKAVEERDSALFRDYLANGGSLEDIPTDDNPGDPDKIKAWAADVEWQPGWSKEAKEKQKENAQRMARIAERKAKEERRQRANRLAARAVKGSKKEKIARSKEQKKSDKENIDKLISLVNDGDMDALPEYMLGLEPGGNGKEIPIWSDEFPAGQIRASLEKWRKQMNMEYLEDMDDDEVRAMFRKLHAKENRPPSYQEFVAMQILRQEIRLREFDNAERELPDSDARPKPRRPRGKKPPTLETPVFDPLPWERRTPKEIVDDGRDFPVMMDGPEDPEILKADLNNLGNRLNRLIDESQQIDKELENPALVGPGYVDNLRKRRAEIKKEIDDVNKRMGDIARRQLDAQAAQGGLFPEAPATYTKRTVGGWRPPQRPSRNRFDGKRDFDVTKRFEIKDTGKKYEITVGDEMRLDEYEDISDRLDMLSQVAGRRDLTDGEKKLQKDLIERQKLIDPFNGKDADKFTAMSQMRQADLDGFEPEPQVELDQLGKWLNKPLGREKPQRLMGGNAAVTVEARPEARPRERVGVSTNTKTLVQSRFRSLDPNKGTIDDWSDEDLIHAIPSIIEMSGLPPLSDDPATRQKQIEALIPKVRQQFKIEGLGDIRRSMRIRNDARSETKLRETYEQLLEENPALYQFVMTHGMPVTVVADRIDLGVGSHGDAGGVYMNGLNMIAIHGDIIDTASDSEDMVGGSAGEGWITGTGPVAILRHELGHYVQNTMDRRIAFGTKTEKEELTKAQTALAKWYNRRHNGFAATVRRWKGEKVSGLPQTKRSKWLTGYGHTSKEEFFAELIAISTSRDDKVRDSVPKELRPHVVTILGSDPWNGGSVVSKVPKRSGRSRRGQNTEIPSRQISSIWDAPDAVPASETTTSWFDEQPSAPTPSGPPTWSDNIWD